MKKSLLTGSLSAACSAVLLLTMTSCSDFPSPGSDPGKKPASEVKDLTVPAGFDWSMTRPVSGVANASIPTEVSLYLDAACTDERKIADLTAASDAAALPLSLPAYAQNIYARYTKADGSNTVLTVPVNGNTVSFTVPADSKPLTMTKADTGEGNFKNVLYYPANGWGTLLFEDLWPSLGDFDFNDFVANYKIQLYTAGKSDNVKSMLVGLQVRAIGGSLPNELYLQMDCVTDGLSVERSDIEILDYKNCTNPEIEVIPGTKGSEPAIFVIRNIYTNPNKPAGSIYLNTERGLGMPESDLVSISFFVEFKRPIPLENIGTENSLDLFNFFIGRGANDGLTEIHMPGFAPSRLGDAAYKAEAGNPNVSTDRYYFAKGNLVWGLNIPAVIPHAYEKTDFLKAYPNFGKWAESGGTAYQDWYTNKPGNRVNENLCQ